MKKYTVTFRGYWDQYSQRMQLSVLAKDKKAAHRQAVLALQPTYALSSIIIRIQELKGE